MNISIKIPSKKKHKYQETKKKKIENHSALMRTDMVSNDGKLA